MAKRLFFVAVLSLFVAGIPTAEDQGTELSTTTPASPENVFFEKPDEAPHKAIWLVDDFEDGFSPGWVDPPGGDTLWIDSIGAAGTDHSARIDGGGNGYSIYHDLGFAQPTGVGLYIRSANTSQYDAYVVLGDDGTTSNNGAIFFTASDTGELLVFTEDIWHSCGPYTSDTWYAIDFVVDWQCKAFDVYVDGSLRQYNLPFRTESTDYFSRLHILNFDISTAWWDQIYMSSPPPGMMIFSDGFERESSCRWSQTVD